MRQFSPLTLLALLTVIAGMVGCGVHQMDCDVPPSISGQPSSQSAVAGNLHYSRSRLRVLLLLFFSGWKTESPFREQHRHLS